MAEIEKNKTNRRRRGAAKKSHVGIIIAAAVIVIAAAVFFTVSACNRGNSAKAADGVMVGDINVGGKNLDQIKEALGGLSDAFDESSVVLGVEGRSETEKINAKDISLKFNVDKTAEKAFNYGKDSAGFFKSKQKVDVGYEFDYDKEALKSIIESFGVIVGGDLKEHEVTIESDYVLIKAGKRGNGVHADEAAEVVIKSFKPDSSTEAKVTMKETDPEPIDLDILYDTVKQDVQNAQFARENGTIIVKDEVDGRELDRKDAEEKLKDFGPGSPDVKIKVIVTPAEIKKQALSSKLFVDVLGQYSSKYAASNKNRSANVEQAGRNINGQTLLPGEVFSYNEAVGPRTAERGFKVASVYEANRVADGMGGGICQTCSTLYPAVLYADLGIVERYNHSLEVSYVPLGMDATVAWNSLDFKFKNTTNYPVKVVCSAGGGTVNVKIVGTNEDKSKTVKIITERTSYTPYTTKEIPDASLAPGKKVSESNGFNGSSVNTYKVYYKNGTEVKREKLGTSVYRMAEKVVRVGPAAPASTTPAATQTPQPTAAPEQTPAPSSPTGGETDQKPDSEVITPQEIQQEYPEGI